MMSFFRQPQQVRQREIEYFDTLREFQPEAFAKRLNHLIEEEFSRKMRVGVVFLCIGTDRSTGDSLGPLVGRGLRERLGRGAVLGTLEQPVHAMNLEFYVRRLRTRFADHLVIAVDASVGSADHVGYATLERGALRPGLGVSKELGEVGDISITGIVGGASSADPLMLQSVRLSMVMCMAERICESIVEATRRWELPVTRENAQICWNGITANTLKKREQRQC